MRLSCSTRCIPDYSFHQALQAISEAGFRYLETSTYETGSALDPTIVHTVRIKETFAHYRLGLSSLNITPLAPTEAPEEGSQAPLCLRREILMARDLWLDVVNVSTGAPETTPRDALVALLRQAADYSVGLGLSLALANAPETHLVTVGDVERLIEEVDRPNLGVLLDVPRLYLAGQDVLAAVEHLAEKILLVRLGDVARGRWVPLGEGEVNPDGVLERLEAVGYTGFVVLEMRITVRAEAERLLVQARERLDPLMQEPPIEPIVRRAASSGGETAASAP